MRTGTARERAGPECRAWGIDLILDMGATQRFKKQDDVLRVELQKGYCGYSAEDGCRVE